MSFYVAIVDKEGNLKQVPKHWEGGTYCVSGNEDAELNITYNYSQIYREVFGDDGLWDFNEESVFSYIDKLYFAIKQLGVERYEGPFWNLDIGAILEDRIPEEYRDKFDELNKEDGIYEETEEIAKFIAEGLENKWIKDGGGYWRPTRGNAGYALSILLQWALLHQDGYFRVHE